MAWPALKIEGEGQFAFVSRCEKSVRLFATAEELRAAKCGAGAQCDPIRLHERCKIKYLPPIKQPGAWEK